MHNEQTAITPNQTAAVSDSRPRPRCRRRPSSQSGQHWDRRVANWDTIAASPAFHRLAQEIVVLARPQADDRVVDLGAGTGLLSLAFAPQVRDVVAIDASPMMLERLAIKADAAGLGNVRPIVADLRALPLPDESVTLAVSNYAFHHLDDAGKEVALSEVRRVLAPGGRLVVCDMMFGLSLHRRDRQLIAHKLWLLARKGPAGWLRIVRNLCRLALRRWEQPATLEVWQRMLLERQFAGVSVQLLQHEGGIAIATRPERPAHTSPS